VEALTETALPPYWKNVELDGLVAGYKTCSVQSTEDFSNFSLII